LATNIIGKQIFEFLISELVDIRLINKQQISENTDIQVELKKNENLISSQNILILKNDKNIISLSDRSKKKNPYLVDILKR